MIQANDVNPAKVTLFAGIMKAHFVNNIWARKDASNELLRVLGPAMYRFFDIVANVAKMFCYEPTEQNKRNMEAGIVGLTPHQERPELWNVFMTRKLDL